jgi:hypothetical protein
MRPGGSDQAVTRPAPCSRPAAPSSSSSTARQQIWRAVLLATSVSQPAEQHASKSAPGSGIPAARGRPRTRSGPVSAPCPRPRECPHRPAAGIPVCRCTLGDDGPHPEHMQVQHIRTPGPDYLGGGLRPLDQPPAVATTDGRHRGESGRSLATSQARQHPIHGFRDPVTAAVAVRPPAGGRFSMAVCRNSRARQRPRECVTR